MATHGKPTRSLPLDVLRGAAILLVIGRHGIGGLAPESGPLAAIIGGWHRIGWSGVDLFFVLSGFLIGGLIFDEVRKHGDFAAWRFVRRRWFRTLPLYAAFLVFLYVERKVECGIWPPTLGLRSNAIALLPHLSFTQNYLAGHVDHTWSLAVEEHFYLGLPLLILLLTARGPAGLRRIPFVSLALIAGCTAGRCLALTGRPFDGGSHVARTHLRIDGLFFGVLIAYLYHFHREWLGRVAARRRLLVAVGLALIAPFPFLEIERDAYVWTIGYTQLYLAYGCLVVAAAFTPSDRGFSPWARLVATIGFYSYGIYIWHLEVGQGPLGWLCGRGFLGGLDPSVRWAIFNAAYVGAAFLAAWLSYRWVEEPMLAMRDRVCPSRGRATPSPAPQVGGPPIVAIPASEPAVVAP